MLQLDLQVALTCLVLAWCSNMAKKACQTVLYSWGWGGQPGAGLQLLRVDQCARPAASGPQHVHIMNRIAHLMALLVPAEGYVEGCRKCPEHLQPVLARLCSPLGPADSSCGDDDDYISSPCGEAMSGQTMQS